jgi:hypothetical protein
MGEMIEFELMARPVRALQPLARNREPDRPELIRLEEAAAARRPGRF